MHRLTLARTTGCRAKRGWPRSNVGVASGGGTAKRLRSLLIANRGEIALRVCRTATESGVQVTTVFTGPDSNSQHTLVSSSMGSAGFLGPAVSGYLDGKKVVEIAKREGCDAVHPGYGFLSENPEFARLCESEGIVFVGPPAAAIEAMGDKSRSKEIMSAAGVACVPGYHGKDQTDGRLKEEAGRIGYPVLLKAVRGGGGKGMRIVDSESQFDEMLASARSEAVNSFGDDAMLVERFIRRPRHVEVQVFADSFGSCVALGERDCSVQRRHQKILEESPAPGLDEAVRRDLWDKARAAAVAVGYRGAGTVEFILDTDSGEFFFMEMNTRLQVEHPVTEMVTGTDLVDWQLRVAAGEPLPMTQDEIEHAIRQRGHAIEARIYAEDAERGFVPASGRLVHVREPDGRAGSVRIDSGFAAGDEVSAHYDPMISKLIVRGADRKSALQLMRSALAEYQIAGPRTNVDFLQRVCSSPAFEDASLDTSFIENNRQELFLDEPVRVDGFAVVALGMVIGQMVASQTATLGFGSVNSGRQVSVRMVKKIGMDGIAETEGRLVRVVPSKTGHTVTVLKDGRVEEVFEDVKTAIRPAYSSEPPANRLRLDGVGTNRVESGHVLTVFLPSGRTEATIVRLDEPESAVDDSLETAVPIAMFWRGRLTRFAIDSPSWVSVSRQETDEHSGGPVGGTDHRLSAEDRARMVLAPMPCKVVRLEVSSGDQVQVGDVVVVIESMKMEMAVRATKAGTVKRVVKSVGEMCGAGRPLVELE